jgi:hypothetical protein
VELITDAAGGDSEPPTWDDGVGVTSLTAGQGEFGGASFALEWGSVSDAGSGPAWYLIYSDAASRGEIDWSRPQLRVPASELSADYFPPGAAFLWNSDIEFNVAVRAMDAAGNVTTNTNTMQGRWDDPEWSGWPATGEWSPGDKLVLTWDEPEIEFGMTVYAPNSDWGDCVDNEAWINTRSFVLGLDSETSGLSLEEVGLAAGAAAGIYMVELRLSGNDGQARTCRLQLLDTAGALKQDLGEFSFGEGLIAEARNTAYLTYFP